MKGWQRIARYVLATGAVAFATVVAMTMRERTPQVVHSPVPRVDPQAAAESANGLTFRINRNKEEVRTEYETLLTYPDGATKLLGVKVTTERAGGRTFVITGKEAKIGDRERHIELTGDVKVVTSDGLELTTDNATYLEDEGVARAPGLVHFSRGRTAGSGVGFAYNKTLNVLTIDQQVAVHVTADEKGQGQLDIAAGSLEFRRNDHVMHFANRMTATRAGQIIEGDTATAHLTDDEEHLKSLELRGNSRITGSDKTAGALQLVSGRDIDLLYGPDGEIIQRATVVGTSVIQLVGDAEQSGRRIEAETVDMTMSADGARPVAMVGRERVKLTIPAENGGVGREVTSTTFDAKGDDSGIRNARFTGSVRFVERGEQLSRDGSSNLLDVVLGPGFGAIEDAQFAQNVRFVDGGLTATAAQASYTVDKGILRLSGTEPGRLVPHVANEQIAVDAVKIDIVLDGPQVNGGGNVKSVLQPKRADARDDDAARVPSMLKGDQPVNVTSGNLEYRDKAKQAIYTGSVVLWQGDTSIKASRIVIDSEKGDLTAEGPVTTVALFKDNDRNGAPRRVRSTATAGAMKYLEAERRITYTGEAHMVGEQGDLKAPRIDVLLGTSGDELNRLEARDGTELKVDGRTTKGQTLVYTGADGQYRVTGAPVSIVDACGRETTGRTLTFSRSTDRIVIDGNEQNRTQTKGKSNCPGS